MHQILDNYNLNLINALLSAVKWTEQGKILVCRRKDSELGKTGNILYILAMQLHTYNKVDDYLYSLLLLIFLKTMIFAW